MYITSRTRPHRTENIRAKVAPASRTVDPYTSGRQLHRAAIRPSASDNGLLTGQALVPVRVDPDRLTRPATRAGRMSAPLVTHLVATRMNLPQTRNRRRANADHANDTYLGVIRAPQAPRTGAYASKYL